MDNVTFILFEAFAVPADVAYLTDLFASAVLSTLPKPTSDLLKESLKANAFRALARVCTVDTDDGNFVF